MSEKQTTDWNGLPPDPQRDGWHWLSSPYADTPEPTLWDADQQQWHYAGWCVPEYVRQNAVYVAPCPWPARVGEATDAR
jgi:hypothetical protein